jgi:hypothetical protein
MGGETRRGWVGMRATWCVLGERATGLESACRAGLCDLGLAKWLVPGLWIWYLTLRRSLSHPRRQTRKQCGRGKTRVALGGSQETQAQHRSQGEAQRLSFY